LERKCDSVPQKSINGGHVCPPYLANECIDLWWANNVYPPYMASISLIVGEVGISTPNTISPVSIDVQKNNFLKNL